jgi:hypothetical protein
MNIKISKFRKALKPPTLCFFFSSVSNRSSVTFVNAKPHRSLSLSLESNRFGSPRRKKMSLRVLNPNAEVLNKSAALHMNINAAKGLQDVLKTNLGPKGTIKMYMLYYATLSLCLYLFSDLLSDFLAFPFQGLLVGPVISSSPKTETLS